VILRSNGKPPNALRAKGVEKEEEEEEEQQEYVGIFESFRTESIKNKNNNKHSFRSNKKVYGGKTH
jgi:hypothetical protein